MISMLTLRPCPTFLLLLSFLIPFLSSFIPFSPLASFPFTSPSPSSLSSPSFTIHCQSLPSYLSYICHTLHLPPTPLALLPPPVSPDSPSITSSPPTSIYSSALLLPSPSLPPSLTGIVHRRKLV